MGSKGKNTDQCGNVRIVKCPAGCYPECPVVFQQQTNYQMPQYQQNMCH